MGQQVSPSAPSAPLPAPSAPPLSPGTVVGMPVVGSEHNAAQPSTSAASTSAAPIAGHAPQAVDIAKLNTSEGAVDKTKCLEVLPSPARCLSDMYWSRVETAKSFYRHFVSGQTKNRYFKFPRTIAENTVLSTLFKLMFGPNVNLDVQLYARNVASPGYYNTKDYSVNLQHPPISTFELSKPIDYGAYSISASRFKPSSLDLENHSFYLYASIKNKSNDPGCFFIRNLTTGYTVANRTSGLLAIKTIQESGGELNTVTYAKYSEEGTLGFDGQYKERLMKGQCNYVEYVPISNVHKGNITKTKENELRKSLEIREVMDGGNVIEMCEIYYNQNPQENKQYKKIETTFAYQEGSSQANQKTVATTHYNKNGEPSRTETAQYSFENNQLVEVSRETRQDSNVAATGPSELLPSQTANVANEAPAPTSEGVNAPLTGYVPVPAAAFMMLTWLALSGAKANSELATVKQELGDLRSRLKRLEEAREQPAGPALPPTADLLGMD